MPSKDAELLAEYQAVMVDICRSLGAEPRMDISDPTYYQEVIDNAVAGLRTPSLKNAVVLKQAGDDALLFTGNNVEPFVVALGYSPERKDWSAGTYYADLRQAVNDFDKQFGTLAYSYNLSLEDIYPLLEEKGFEPTHKNVRALMLNTNDFEDVSEYINESLTRLFDDEIDSCEEILEKSPARTMPEKSFHVRSAEEIASATAMGSTKEQQDLLATFNKLLAARGSKAFFVDPPEKDTVWGVIELEVILNDDSKACKEYIQAFYDYYVQARNEECLEPFQMDFDKALEEFKALHADDPRYANATIEANDWLDPDEFDSRIFDLDAEALRVIRDVNVGFTPLFDDLMRRHYLISQVEVDSIVTKHQNGLKDLPDAQVADFSADDLSYFDLSNLDLGTVNSVGKEVCDPVSFERSNLAYTNFFHDELKGANFKDCVAFGTAFVGSNLGGCDFSGAVLDGVDFTNALMKDTIFDETIIKDVILPNGQKLSIDDPADSLAVMERLVNTKADAPTNEVSVDDLVAQIKEKDDIVFADYWTRDEVVNRLAFEGIELDSSNFEKVIEYTQDILSDHDMDLEEITRYARSFVPKETKAREVSPKQEKRSRATSLDELASQAREKADQRNNQLQDDRMTNSQKRSR